MLEWLIQTILPEIIHLLELIGIIIVTIGSLKTFSHYIMFFVFKKKYHIKLELGYCLALGLEFKMGAEILKTVLIRDLSEIWILGSIIVLRALLSVLLHFEMKGGDELMDEDALLSDREDLIVELNKKDEEIKALKERCEAAEK